jgi:type I restriction enzyme S subunit
MFKRAPHLGGETKYRTYNRLHSGEIVYSKLFGWEGSVAVVPPDFEGLCVSSEFPTFEFDERCVAPGYFSHLVGWQGLHDMMAASTSGLGQRRQRVQVEDFLSIRVPLPDVEEQHRVVHRLGRLADAAGRVGNRATGQNTAHEALHERLVSEVSTAVTLRKILSLDCVIENVEPSSQFKLAGVYGFGRGIFSRGILRGAETSYRNLHRLRTGQVVMSRLKAFEGAVAMVPDEFDGWVVSPEFPTFSLKVESIHPGYMEMLCEWSGLRDLLGRASKGIGARRERVGAEAFLSVSVPLPGMERQRELAAVYSKIRRIRSIQRYRQQILDSLWRSALNAAFADVG